MLPLRIIKVGGSLFDLGDMAVRLFSWLKRQSTAANVFVAGGGPLAEAVREWDHRFQLGEEASHWMCIDLLDTTASLLAKLLPEASLTKDWQSLGAQSLQVFASASFLRDHEWSLPGAKLPHSWDVSSDSIAARVAEVTQAAELVLLKSTLTSTELVDAHFTKGIQNIAHVRVVNLRDEGFPERPFS